MTAQRLTTKSWSRTPLRTTVYLLEQAPEATRPRRDSSIWFAVSLIACFFGAALGMIALVAALDYVPPDVAGMVAK